MGMEVLRPKDCLQPGAVLAYHRKPNASPSLNAHQKPSSKPASAPKRRPAKGGAGSHVVAGQVTILKRGEPLESCRQREAVFGTGLLGPDPERMPRRTRLARPKGGAAPQNVYAGTAFAASPSPSALPLPRFSRRKDTEANVDYWATQDLRRLLGLD